MPESKFRGSEPAFLHLENISRSIGAQRVLDGVDLTVDQGQLVSLLGPSGCGKTSLLRIIAGLAPCDQGLVRLNGKDLARVPTHQRNIGVVFQSYALFPHLSVGDNVAFGLKARGTNAEEIRRQVSKYLDLVKLSHLKSQAITALSGGQQQRVAVARALAVGPDLLLLDEPFSALDRKLRESMQIDLRALLRSSGITAIFVTHDQEEALLMSDRIAVMQAGRVEEYGDPNHIYLRPRCAFTFDFVGLSTRLAATVRENRGGITTFETRYGTITATAGGRAARGEKVWLGIRPENLSPDLPGDAARETPNALTVTLQHNVLHGSRRYLHFHAAEEDRILCEAHPGRGMTWQEGQTCRLNVEPDDVLFFPATPEAP